MECVGEAEEAWTSFVSVLSGCTFSLFSLLAQPFVGGGGGGSIFVLLLSF